MNSISFMTMDMFVTGIVQGLVLSLLSYAVMIPFRLLNLPDVSVEGAYPLAGAVCATLLVTSGVHPVMAILAAALCTGIMGIVVSVVIERLNVNSLLAGIIMSTMAYSVTLRIMGKPNLALNAVTTLFTHSAVHNCLVLLAIVGSMALGLYLFLITEVGLRLRAVGYNHAFARKQSISIFAYTLCGLCISGLFTGVAASCMVQLQRYMDINMGIGMVIHALASLMIGEALVGNTTLFRQLLAPIAGALIYQQIQGIAFSCGLMPSDLKLFTGVLVLVIIAVNRRNIN